MQEKVLIVQDSSTPKKIAYPVYDKEKLWLMSSEDFNTWRIKHDFPRIVMFLQQELNGFIEWQEEQQISTEQLITEGISGFIIEQGFHQLDMFNEDTQDLKRPHKKFLPYFTWLKKKKLKPHKSITDYTIRPDKYSWNPKTRTNEVYLLKKLRLLDLGGVELKGLSLGEGSRTTPGNKRFEFTCLDNIKFEQCYHPPSPLNFSSISNAIIKNCSFHHFSAFSTNFTGLYIERCSLQKWTLSKCAMDGFINNSRIKESEIKYWKFYKTNFFDFFTALQIFDSCFSFHEKDYLQYKQVKNAYAAQGDKAESGKYYYIERKAHFKARKKYFSYNRWKLRRTLAKNPYSSFFSDVKQKFKSKETTFFNACWNFLMFVGFRFKIITSKDYLQHYYLLFFDYLDKVVRGYGEKPLRIIKTLLFFLSFFTLIDYLFFSLKKDFFYVLYNNLLVFIGQGEFSDLGITFLLMRISQTLLGIFLISLFVADFSSKHRY